MQHMMFLGSITSCMNDTYSSMQDREVLKSKKWSGYNKTFYSFGNSFKLKTCSHYIQQIVFYWVVVYHFLRVVECSKFDKVVHTILKCSKTKSMTFLSIHVKEMQSIALY